MGGDRDRVGSSPRVRKGGRPLVRQKTRPRASERPPGELLLRGRDLRLSYGRSIALAGATIDVRAGEIVVLRGKSGSGKSSLLYCLAGVVRPDAGEVWYGGRAVTGMSDDEVSALRRREFGFVFQFGDLVPELSIAENVGLPLRLNGQASPSVGPRVEAVLERLGIGELARKRPGEVSGGEAQRAAVARALVHSPRVVFADEPTGALDTENSDAVLKEFLGLARTAGSAVVLVTHEANVAAVGDRHLSVVDGTVRPPSGDS
ncbi:MAG: ABC transporter ATP-binding protein [Acidobacteria bacterium]|nr:ABC transporter ATP-binding protein [Acidobacteriota bacterium]